MLTTGNNSEFSQHPIDNLNLFRQLLYQIKYSTLTIQLVGCVFSQH